MLAFYLLKEERLKTIGKLTIAYGEKKNEVEIKNMAREVFVNLGRSIAEAIINLRLTDKNYFLAM